MKYHLFHSHEVTQARAYLDKLIAQQAIVEVKKINPKRSISQNSYLHLLLGAFGAHFGYSLEEAKLIYKEVSQDIYYYEKKGRTFIRSSADLSKEEMARTIDRFREKSAEAGYPLPLATDEAWLRSLENAIETAKHYL